MAAILVRNIPEETMLALKSMAKRDKLSTEAEVRRILCSAVEEKPRVKVGTELAKFAQKWRKELEGFNPERDRTPVKAATFD